MPEKTKAETRFSNFEYNGWFAEPFFEPLRLYGSIGSIYTALKFMKIDPSEVKYVGGASSPTDTLVSFHMPKSHYILNASLAGFNFKADFVDWSQAPIITNIIDSATRAAAQELKTEIVRHQLQITLQVVPSMPVKELTRSFSPFITRPAKDIEFNGFILHTVDGMFMVDKSAIHDNGLYIRIIQRFAGKASMEAMAKVMFDEENWLAATLGIEIV
jgi:hypothetical protein